MIIIDKIIIVTARPGGTFFCVSQNMEGPKIAEINRAISKGEIMASAYLIPAKIITSAARVIMRWLLFL